MPAPVLATKMFMPPARRNAVLRPRLMERLSEGQEQGPALALVCAPAGFGKSTLLSTWIDQRKRQNPKFRVAWLSLDEGDSDPSRFLLYLAAALHGVDSSCGADAMAALHSPQPPSAESILTDLINEIDGIAEDILLVLDDYHTVQSPQVDEELAFVLEHLPARMQVAIATREDPMLPLARLRARGGPTELRAADLRFSPEEAGDFLGRVMGLELTTEDIAALESPTEGWIAGLQLAALSMQGQEDIAGFIQSFTGSHRFVLDYLAEEVLRRQPEGIQTFLLRTSVLDRFCGPLSDASCKKTGARLPASPPPASRPWNTWSPLRLLAEIMGLAEGGGFIRLFLDEGAPMARLLRAAAAQGMTPAYLGKLLTAFAGEKKDRECAMALLSERDLEVLKLIAEGLSNQAIGERLFLALDTIKGHNRRIFDKLEVERRTEAIARGRELGLL
jgi:ATP/maltotriose-dependent transcriptional regulator MalT